MPAFAKSANATGIVIRSASALDTLATEDTDMSIRNLQGMFAPRSVAVIGPSTKPQSAGAALMRNLLQAGFGGPILPVHPKATAIQGVLAYRDVASLPVAPDLAVIATPPEAVPQLIADLGARGTRAVVVITAGLTDDCKEGSAVVGRRQQLLNAARPHLLRIIGPNCLGVAVPGIGLNATFGPAAPLPGSIAFLTQSGAMATTVLDWALPRGIGFSAIVSMGDMCDVDFGDLLDYFALDDNTTAILIYAEAITHARKFMSAARRAARAKPVIVVKAGRLEEGARAAASHTGALAGADAVYEAAFRRAGMLRVHEIDELFDAAATLARMSAQRGSRLAIVTNGGGLGVLATDRLIEEGGTLAILSPETITKLDGVLPPTWSRGNPVDIIGDAGAQRYSDAVSALMAEPNTDGLLVINCPTGVSTPLDAANGLVETLSDRFLAKSRPNIFTSWMGDATAREGRACLIAAGIPHYDTVERAVRAFMHLVRYQQSQELLLQTPSSSAPFAAADVQAAKAIIRQVLSDGREWLDPAEVAAFLRCYDVPTARTEAVVDAAEAARSAENIKGPIALKIRSRDVIHKSDVGGVMLNLVGPTEVAAAADRMISHIHAALPNARLEGFIVQEMVLRPGSYELIAGITTDPTFGPVILFGHGGTAVEVVRDKSLELPPLDTSLARRQIERTRIASLLTGYRDRPAVHIEKLVEVLISLGQIAADHSEIAELDINPLLCDQAGVIALDGRIRVNPASATAQSRMAIRPYPKSLESTVNASDGVSYYVRPIRPEDEPALRQMASSVAVEELWHEFFSPLRDGSRRSAARLSQIDYDREMTLVAWDGDALVGIARMTADPDFEAADCAILVRDWSHNLAGELMRLLLEAAAVQGIRRVISVLPASRAALSKLFEDLGFTLEVHDADPSCLLARRTDLRSR